MGFKFATLLCLLAVLHGSYAYDYVTKSGSVTINKDTNGYYVNADLSYNYNDASDSEGYDSDIAQMMLALYTSQTMFSSYCLDFNYYYCSSYGCSEYTWESTTASYPSFDVLTAYPASANLYLDYGNWELNSNAIIASSCSNDIYYNYGTNRSGILALGVNNTLNNFINTSMFSISLARDGSSGTLQFYSNEDVVSSSAYTGQLYTTEDWQVAPTSVYITLGSNFISTTAGLIFDINSPGIGLPQFVFDDIIEDIETTADISCTSDTYSPICYYSGDISDLPTITLNIQGVDIAIPPTVYVQDATDDDTYVDQMTLNFRLVDSGESGYNYVTETFSGYIILDSSFMSYYYTEFSYNGGSPTITIYSPYTSNIIWPFIVGGVLGFVVIVFIVCCCIRKRKNRLAQQAAARLIVVNEGINTSDQAPLVANQANLPYPAQNYPAQNYPAQNYPAPQHNQAYPPQNYPPYGYDPQQGNYGYPQFPNQPAPYTGNGFGAGNVQPGQYTGNYMPPQQGQFYGNGQGNVPPTQTQTQTQAQALPQAKP